MTQPSSNRTVLIGITSALQRATMTKGSRKREPS